MATPQFTKQQIDAELARREALRQKQARPLGPSKGDIPAVAFKALSGITGGAPEILLREPKALSPRGQNPIGAAIGGPIGGSALGQVKRIEGRSIPGFPARLLEKELPKALQTKTQFGDILGSIAEIGGGVLGVPGRAAAKTAVETTKAGVRGFSPSLAKATVDAVKFAEKVQADFSSLIRKAGQRFGSQIDEIEKVNPSAAVDVSDAFTTLARDFQENTDVARRVISGLKASGDTDVARLFENLGREDIVKLSLKESQKILRAIKKAPGLITKFKKGVASRFDENEIPLLRFIASVRKSQLEAFPQFSKTLGEFSNTMRKFDQVKQFFKEGKTIGAIKKGFGDAQLDEKALQSLSPGVVKEIGGVRRAATALQGAKYIGRTAVIGVLGGLIAGKVIGAFSPDDSGS